MTETPEQSTSISSILAGLLVGAAIGGAVSLLFAPKPGRETREELAQRLDELKECVDETTRQVTECVKERLDEVKADLAKAVEDARTVAAQHADELHRRREMP